MDSVTLPQNKYMKRHVADHTTTDGHRYGRTPKGNHVTFLNLYNIVAYIVCVKTNDEELFINAFPLKIHIILFLDRLRRIDVVSSTGNLSS